MFSSFVAHMKAEAEVFKTIVCFFLDFIDNARGEMWTCYWSILETCTTEMELQMDSYLAA
jgi:hypothetical protein